MTKTKTQFLLLLFIITFACGREETTNITSATVEDIFETDEFTGKSLPRVGPNTIVLHSLKSSFGTFHHYVSKVRGDYHIDFYRSDVRRSKVLSVSYFKDTKTISHGALD